jgi:signal peptidase
MQRESFQKPLFLWMFHVSKKVEDSVRKRRVVEVSVLVGLAVAVAVFLVFYRPVSLGGDTRYEPVLTGSMEPAISVGSVVAIKPVDSDALRVGDVICFRFGDSMLVTHRIVNVTAEGFLTKGDANEELDVGVVRKENVVGVVVFVIPWVGHLGAFVRMPLGFVVLLVVPACLIIVFEVRSIMSEMKKLGKEKEESEDEKSNPC